MKDNIDELIDNGTLESEMSSALEAYESEDYEIAWEYYLKVYNSKKASREQKAESSYMLCEIMKVISIDSQLISDLMNNDIGLKKVALTKPVTPEYTRKYIGRKYLKTSADYDYIKGLVEYGLSCVDCGPKKNFNYEYNDENAEVALAWADKMIRYDNIEVKQAAYIIYAKYYFVKCKSDNTDFYVNLYGDNVLNAKELNEEDQYVNYFLGHLYANPKFKKYKDEEYYNPKEGYEYFQKVVDVADDPLLLQSAKEIIHMLETKYPTMIGKENGEKIIQENDDEFLDDESVDD